MARSLTTLLSAATIAVLAVSCAHFDSKPLALAEAAAAFEQRSLDSPELRKFIEKNLGHELKEWPATWDLEMLTLAAFFYHPSLDEARARWHSAQAAEISAGGRPNPTFGIQPGFNFNAASSVASPWIPGATIDLPIETAGKRGLRIAHARQQSEAARAELLVAAWKVRAELLDALNESDFAGSMMNVLEDREIALSGLANRMDQRVDAGAASKAESALTRSAASKAQLEAYSSKNKWVTAKYRVAAAIGIPGESFVWNRNVKMKYVDAKPLTYVMALVPGEVEEARRSNTLRPVYKEFNSHPYAIPALPTRKLNKWLGLWNIISTTNYATLRRQILEQRPDVRVALTGYETAQLALRLEIAKQYPDLHLGTGYQWDQGESKWSFLNLSAELPVLNRNQGPIAEARARREEAAAKVITLQTRIAAELDIALSAHTSLVERPPFVWSRFEMQLRHYKLVIEQVAAGAADGSELLQAKLDLLDAHQTVIEERLHVKRAYAQLENVLMQSLEKPGDIALAVPTPAAIETTPRTEKETR